MVRGWLRPSRGGSKLPPATLNSRKGEYDSWEPLGRLLLPDMHRRVDEMLRERRSAGREAAARSSITDAQPNAADNEDPRVGLGRSNDVTSAPAANESNENMSESPDDGPRGGPSHDSSPRSANPGHGGAHDGDDDSRGAMDGTCPAAPGNHTSVESNRTPEDTSNSNNIAGPGGLPPAPTSPLSNTSAEAHLAMTSSHASLSPYQRSAEPNWGFNPSIPQQVQVFCANCDPEAQTDRYNLLSDYLCDLCWRDFIAWRGDSPEATHNSSGSSSPELRASDDPISTNVSAYAASFYNAESHRPTQHPPLGWPTRPPCHGPQQPVHYMTHEGGPPNAARPPTPFRPVTAPPAYSKSLFHTHSTCAMHACVPTVCHAWPPTPGDHFHPPNSYCEIACPPPPTHNPHTYSQTPILPPRSAWSDADPPMARPTTVSTFPAALAGDLYATARQPPALHMANQPPQPIFHTSRQTHAYAAASKAAQEAYHRAMGCS